MKNHLLIPKPFFLIGFCLLSILSIAQGPTDDDPVDPGAISVFTIQNMSFGAFYQGTGGTVVIATNGSRSVTGSVVPLNFGFSYFQAIFELEAPSGTIISILNGPNATLTGSNGGSMVMQIGGSDPASPFNVTVPSPGRTTINIGGTLNVGNPVASPPGTYRGTFSVTFNYE